MASLRNAQREVRRRNSKFGGTASHSSLDSMARKLKSVGGYYSLNISPSAKRARAAELALQNSSAPPGGQLKAQRQSAAPTFGPTTVYEDSSSVAQRLLDDRRSKEDNFGETRTEFEISPAGDAGAAAAGAFGDMPSHSTLLGMGPTTTMEEGKSKGSSETKYSDAGGRLLRTSKMQPRPPISNLEGTINIMSSHPFLAFSCFLVPVGFWAPGNMADHYVFLINFIAVVPMAWLIGKATEDLSGSTSEVVAGLVNATFGNVVEMMLCIASIRSNQIIVAQCTLIGSMLSNLLLVMGTAFMVGGYFYKTQYFSQQGASTQTSLLSLSVSSLAMPTVYANVLGGHKKDWDNMLRISRYSSIMLLFLYFSYLYFQLISHTDLFEEDDSEDDLDFVDDPPDLSFGAAVTLLCACTLISAVQTEMVINTIEGAIEEWHISAEFIGIILLPVIGNAAEHYTAITVAARNKVDLSLAVACGSSCQVSLMVTPLTVLAGWYYGRDMSLNFHIFQIVVLVASISLVTAILGNGKCNWLEGLMLVTIYLLICMIYFFEETRPESSLALLD